jgi:hypothetical protein
MNFEMHDEFLEPIYNEAGAKLPSTWQRVSDRQFPALDFSPPRLIMRVRPNSIVQAGQLIRRGRTRFLLAAHQETPDYRSFWAFEANRLLTWKQQTSATDALTGLSKSDGWATNGEIWVAWEIMTRQPYEREIGVPNELSRLLTHQPIEINHTVDQQQVKRVNFALGLRVCEVA